MGELGLEVEPDVVVGLLEAITGPIIPPCACAGVSLSNTLAAAARKRSPVELYNMLISDSLSDSSKVS